MNGAVEINSNTRVVSILSCSIKHRLSAEAKVGDVCSISVCYSVCTVQWLIDWYAVLSQGAAGNKGLV